MTKLHYKKDTWKIKLKKEEPKNVKIPTFIKTNLKNLDAQTYCNKYRVTVHYNITEQKYNYGLKKL